MTAKYTESLHDPIDFALHVKDSGETTDLIFKPSCNEYMIRETKNGKTRQYRNTTKTFIRKFGRILSQYRYDENHDKLFAHNWAFRLDNDQDYCDTDTVAQILSSAAKSKDTVRLLPIGVICDRSNFDRPIEIDENRRYDKGILKLMARYVQDESLHDKTNEIMSIGVWPDLNHTYAFLYAMRYHFGIEYIYDFIDCLDQLPTLFMMDAITDLLTLSKSDIDSKYDCTNEDIAQYMKTHTPIKFDKRAWHRYAIGNSAAQGMPLTKYGEYDYAYRCNNDFIVIWKDVLKMQLQVKNDITEKYPRFIKSEHHNLSMQLGLRTTDDPINTQRRYTVKRHHKFEAKGDEWVAMTPSKSQDMLDEAAYQHNCLASYVESAAKGYTNIVFIRHRRTPDTPWITVETDDDLNVKQAYLRYNKPLDDEASAALEQWRETIRKGREK